MQNIKSNQPNRNLELIIDMDDCVVNLSKFMINQYNKDFNDNMDWRENQVYWWGDCNAPKSYFENLLLQGGTFINPEPIPNAIETLNKLHSEGFNIIFCTYPQYTSNQCIQEKVQWLQQYFPWFNVDKNLVFTGNKALLAKKNRILLDDNLNFIIPFYKQGGISIIFNQGWNQHKDIKGSFDGYRISDFHTFYDLVHTLESKSFRLKYEL